MTKKEIVKKISEDIGLTQLKTKDIVQRTLDAIIQTYALGDPALYRLALIVRGADTPYKELAPEAMGLEAVADGFRRIYDDDQAQLEAEMVVYDALYAYCRALDGS